MSDGENEQVMTAREQRALIRQVQRMGTNMNQNTADVNMALRGLQQQMQQQGARLREDLNPVPGLTPHATRELEAYDGRLGVLFSDWLEKFTIVAEAQGWNNVRRCSVLPAFLKGAAYTAWKNLTDAEKQNYNDLRQALLQRLQPAYATRFIQKEFASRRQRPDEPVIEFAYELERLVNAGYPNLPDQNKAEFLLTNFIDKLSAQLKTLVMLFDPQTFEEARAKAQQIEQNQKLAQNSAAVNMLVNPMSVLGVSSSAFADPQLYALGAASPVASTAPEVSKDNTVLFEIGKIADKLEQILTSQMRINSAADSAFSGERRTDYRPRSPAFVNRSPSPTYTAQAPPQNRQPPQYLERNSFNRNGSPITCYRCQGKGHMAATCRAPRSVPPMQFVTGNFQQQNSPEYAPRNFGFSQSRSVSSFGPSAGQMNTFRLGRAPTPAPEPDSVPVRPLSLRISSQETDKPAQPALALSASSSRPQTSPDFCNLQAENTALRQENARLAATIFPSTSMFSKCHVPPSAASNNVLTCGHTGFDWFSLPAACRASVACPNGHILLYRDVCIEPSCTVEFCATCQHAKACFNCKPENVQSAAQRSDNRANRQRNIGAIIPQDISHFPPIATHFQNSDLSSAQATASSRLSPCRLLSSPLDFPNYLHDYPAAGHPEFLNLPRTDFRTATGAENRRGRPVDVENADENVDENADENVDENADENVVSSTVSFSPPNTGFSWHAEQSDTTLDAEIEQLGLATTFLPIRPDQSEALLPRLFSPPPCLPVAQSAPSGSQIVALPGNQPQLGCPQSREVFPGVRVTCTKNVVAVPVATVAPIDKVLASVDAMLYPKGYPLGKQTSTVAQNYSTETDSDEPVPVKKKHFRKRQKRVKIYRCETKDLGKRNICGDTDSSDDQQEPTRRNATTVRPTASILPHVFMCTLLFTNSMAAQTRLAAPNPLLCHASDTRATWRLPETVPCNPNTADRVSEPIPALLAIYKRNYVQYKTKAWLCRKVTQTVSVKSWLFNDEHLKKETTKIEPIDTQECEQIIRFKKCSVGSMVEKGGLLQTENKLDWEYTQGWGDCCYWKTFEATNCFAFQTVVLKRHGHDIMESPAGVVSHCDYSEAHCTLADSSLLTWTVDKRERCEFVPWKSIEGMQRGNVWVAADGNLALTTDPHSKSDQYNDCRGNTLVMSDQGVPFRSLGRPVAVVNPRSKRTISGLPVIEPIVGVTTRIWYPPHHAVMEPMLRHWRTVTGVTTRIRTTPYHQRIEMRSNNHTNSPLFSKPFNKFLNATERRKMRGSLNRHVRSAQETEPENDDSSNGVVMSDHLAMALQAIEYRLQETVRFSFDHSVAATCQGMNAIVRILSASILGNPTIAARILLNRSDIVARASMQALEISVCHELANSEFSFSAMSEPCTRELPMSFKGHHENFTGYIDPLTNIIHSSGTPEDCALSESVPVQLRNQSFLYHKDGSLIKVNWERLPALPWPATNLSFFDLHLESLIFHKIVMYNMSEFQGHSSLNDLLSAVHQHHQIFEALGVNARRYGGEPDVDQVASAITDRGFFAFIYGLKVNWWQVWVFLVCLKVSIGTLVWCCCPCKVIQSRTPATYLADRWREHRQRTHQPLPQNSSLTTETSFNADIPRVIIHSPTLPTSTPEPVHASTPRNPLINTHQQAPTASASSAIGILAQNQTPNETYTVQGGNSHPSASTPSDQETSTVALRNNNTQTERTRLRNMQPRRSVLWRSSPLLFEIPSPRIDVESFTDTEASIHHLTPQRAAKADVSKVVLVVDGVAIRGLLDTGSMLTLAPSSIVRWHKVSSAQISTVFTLAGYLPLLGTAMVQISFGAAPRKSYKHIIHIVESRFLGEQCIIGTDFLTKFPSLTLDYVTGQLTIDHSVVPMGLSSDPHVFVNAELFCAPVHIDRSYNASVPEKIIPLGASVFPLVIQGVCVLALLDTGASLTVIPDRLVPALRAHKIDHPHTDNVTTLAGTVPLIGSIRVTMFLGRVEIDDIVHIVPEKYCKYDCIVGTDILQMLPPPLSIDYTEGTLEVGTNNILPMGRKRIMKLVQSIHVCNTVEIGPRMCDRLDCYVKDFDADCQIIAWPHEDLITKCGVVMPEVLLTPEQGKVSIYVANPGSTPVTLYADSTLATAEVLLPDVHQIAQLNTFADEREGPHVHSQEPARSTQLNESILKEIDEMFDLSGTDLDGEELVLLKLFLHRNRDVFAKTELDLGRSTAVKFRIDTGDAVPIRQRPYRVPESQKEEVLRQLRKLEEAGIISASNSPWASPLVIVKKKDSTLRLCVDYRKLNAVTRKDSFPLPRIDELLDHLGNAQYFSTLDLFAGYHQIEIAKEDRAKTAFTTFAGLYQWNTMPFGLACAPSVFQRTLEFLLLGLNWKNCLVYIDDIICFSPDFETHLRDLSSIFQRFRDGNLKCKPKKCFFVRPKVPYLGHTISKHGIEPDESKIKAVRDMPSPKDLTGVKQALGFLQFYRKFVASFAEIASPLYVLQRKGVQFKWAEDCETAFRTLIDRLITAPILAFPDFQREFLLATDASGFGIGAVLSQVLDDELEHPIAFASRALQKHERNYSTIEKECLAIVWGIKEFKHYLYGRPFVVITDHSPLSYMYQSTTDSTRLQKWRLQLQQYVFEVRYRRGAANANADGLSRILPEEPTETNQENPQTDVKATTEDAQIHALTPTSDMYQRQMKDPELRPLIDYLANGKLPDSESESHRIQFLAQHHKLDLNGTLLWAHEGPGLVPRPYPMVVPKSLRAEIVEAYHDDVYAGGHLGFAKTLDKIKRHYYWPGMWVEVKHWCRTCVPCAMRKDPPAKVRAPLVPLPVVGAFDRLAVDCLGPLPLTESGNRHIVIFSDYLTRWPEAFCTPDTKATTIARLLVDEVISRHGAPRQLLSDQGQNFLSKLVAEICDLFQTRKVNTTAYHPSTDGLVERFNRTLLAMLACFVSSHQRDWDRLVSLVLFAYRCSTHASVGDSPFFLLYGRDPYTPIDVILASEPRIYREIEDYRADITQALQQAWQLAQEHLVQAQARQKHYYDRTVRNYEFSVGDRVWLYTPAVKKGKTPKLSRFWKGPFRIVEMASPNARIVPTDAPRKPPVTVHVNRLKPCYESHVPNPALIPTIDEGEEQPEQTENRNNSDVSRATLTDQPEHSTQNHQQILDVMPPQDLPALTNQHGSKAAASSKTNQTEELAPPTHKYNLRSKTQKT